MDAATQLHVRLAVAENELFHARFEAHCAREANRFIVESLHRASAAHIAQSPPLHNIDSAFFAGPQAIGHPRVFPPAQANPNELQTKFEQVERDCQDLKAHIKELLTAQRNQANASVPALRGPSPLRCGQKWTQGRVSSGLTPSPPPFYSIRHGQVGLMNQDKDDAWGSASANGENGRNAASDDVGWHRASKVNGVSQVPKLQPNIYDSLVQETKLNDHLRMFEIKSEKIEEDQKVVHAKAKHASIAPTWFTGLANAHRHSFHSHHVPPYGWRNHASNEHTRFTARGRPAYRDWDAEPRPDGAAQAQDIAYSEHAKTGNSPDDGASDRTERPHGLIAPISGRAESGKLQAETSQLPSGQVGPQTLKEETSNSPTTKQDANAAVEPSIPSRHSHGPTLDLLEGRVTSMSHPEPLDVWSALIPTNTHKLSSPQSETMFPTQLPTVEPPKAGTSESKLKDQHGRPLISYAESDGFDDEESDRNDKENDRLAENWDHPHGDEMGLDSDDGDDDVHETTEQESAGYDDSDEDNKRMSAGASKHEHLRVADRPILKPGARLRKGRGADFVTLGVHEATDPVDDLTTRFPATSFTGLKKYSGAAEFDLDFGGDRRSVARGGHGQGVMRKVKEWIEHDEDTGSEEGEIADARMASLQKDESEELDY